MAPPSVQFALVVEDEPTFALAMADAIQQETSYAVHMVAGIHRASQWMDSRPIGSVKLIVVDRQLKQRIRGGIQDGLEGIPVFQTHKAVSPDVKIIIWTSYNDPGSILAARNAGADAFLSKDRLGQLKDLEEDLRIILDREDGWVELL